MENASQMHFQLLNMLQTQPNMKIKYPMVELMTFKHQIPAVKKQDFLILSCECALTAHFLKRSLKHCTFPLCGKRSLFPHSLAQENSSHFQVIYKICTDLTKRILVARDTCLSCTGHPQATIFPGWLLLSITWADARHKTQSPHNRATSEHNHGCLEKADNTLCQTHNSHVPLPTPGI